MAITLSSLQVEFLANTKDLERGFNYAQQASTNFARNAVIQASILNQYLARPLQTLLQTQIAYRDLTERSEITFKQLLGNIEKSRTLIADLKQFAVSTPFEFSGLLNSSKQLLAFGISAENLRPTIRAISDAIAGLGGTEETLQRVNYAFGKLSSEGKLSAAVMRQLTTAGIQGWQILADKLGISVEQLRKFTKQGLIPASFALSTLLVGIENRFENMAAKFGNTFAAAFSNLKDAAIQTFDAVLLPLLDRFKEIILSSSRGLLELAQSFSAMDAETKKLLGTLPFVAIAMGAFIVSALTVPVVLGAIISPIGLLGVSLSVYAYKVLSSKEATDQFIATFKTQLPSIVSVAKLVFEGAIIVSIGKTIIQMALFGGSVFNVARIVATTGISSLVFFGATFSRLVGFILPAIAAVRSFTISIGVLGGTRTIISSLIVGIERLGFVAGATSTILHTLGNTGVLAAFKTSIAAATTSLTTFFTFIATSAATLFNPLTFAILALGVFVVGAFENYTKLGAALTDNTTQRSEKIKTALVKSMEVIKESAIVSVAAIIAILKVLGDIIGWIIGVVLKLVHWFYQLETAIVNITRKIFTLGQATDISAGSMEDMRLTVERTLGAFPHYQESLKQTRALTEHLSGSLGTLGKGFSTLGQQVGQVGQSSGLQGSELFKKINTKVIELKRAERVLAETEKQFRIKRLNEQAHLIPPLDPRYFISQANLIRAQTEQVKNLKKEIVELKKEASKPVQKDAFGDFSRLQAQSDRETAALKKLLAGNSEEKRKALKVDENAHKNSQKAIQAFEHEAFNQQIRTRVNIQKGLLKASDDIEKEKERARKASFEKAQRIAKQEHDAQLSYLNSLAKKISDLKQGSQGVNVEWEIANGVLRNASRQYQLIARERANTIKFLEEQRKITEAFKSLQEEVSSFDTNASTNNLAQQFLNKLNTGDAAKISPAKKQQLLQQQLLNIRTKEAAEATREYNDALASVNTRLDDEDTIAGRVNTRLAEMFNQYQNLAKSISPEQLKTLKDLVENDERIKERVKVLKEQNNEYKNEVNRLTSLAEKKKELTELEKVNADIARGTYSLLNKLQTQELQNLAKKADLEIKAKVRREQEIKELETIADIQQRLSFDKEEARSRLDRSNEVFRGEGNVQSEESIKARAVEKYKDALKGLTAEKRKQIIQSIEQNAIDTDYYNKQSIALNAFNEGLDTVNKQIKELGGHQVSESVAKFLQVIKENGIELTEDIMYFLGILETQDKIKEKLEAQKEVFREFANGVSQIFENSFLDLFNNGFKNFFSNIGKGFEQLLEQIAAKILASTVLNFLLGAIGGSSAVKSFGGIFGREVGGSVSGGTPYVVGERGKELFVPQTSGRIVPNDKMNKSNKSTPVINMYISTRDADSFRKSQSQILSDAYKSMNVQTRRNGT